VNSSANEDDQVITFGSTVRQSGARQNGLALIAALALLGGCQGGQSGDDDTGDAAPVTLPPSTPTTPTNTARTISGAPLASVQAGTNYFFQPSAADAEGDALTFQISSKPAWATFDAASGALSGTPQAANVGATANVVISVSDGKASAALAAFTLTVQAASSTPPANSAPTIAGAPSGSVTAGQAYSFQPSASDANGDALTFSISNKPVWASFSSGTGRLTGTPAAANVGTYANIVVSVSDGKASAALGAFTISVAAAPNHAPTISGAPGKSVTAGNAYSFQPSAADSDQDSLAFTIQNKPSWASFNTATGSLSGTPATVNAGTYASIVISVSDGRATAALPSFTLTVNSPTNHAPTITGSPATTVIAASAYNFQPTAADSDNDTLTFSIQGKPSWAQFSTTTGKLSGTPAVGDVGSYSNIVITVSDGKLSTALATFAIAVTQNANGSASLNWQPPTQNTDGSSLTDLAGYRIVYGTSATALTQTVDVPGAGMTAYVVQNLSPATYYFAIKAYTSGGSESDVSNVVSKAIQ
jgi:hypothetical protein